MKRTLAVLFSSLLASTAPDTSRGFSPNTIHVGRKKTFLHASDVRFDVLDQHDDMQQHAEGPIPSQEQITRPAPKFGWNKLPAKDSLRRVGQDHTAAGWFLNLIEACHWTTLPVGFLSTMSIVQHYDAWFDLLGRDSLRVTMWLAFPIVQGAASLAPLVQHIYEDWQIAPPSANDDEGAPRIGEATNARLREISYAVLFSLLGLSWTMAAHAIAGWDDARGLLLVSSAGLMAFGSLGDREHLLTRYVPSAPPIPMSTLAWFVYSSVLVWCMAFQPLASGDMFSGTEPVAVGLKAMILLPVVFSAIGGVVEGAICENTFDQRYHLGAILLMFSGVVIQWQGLLALGEHLSS